VLEQQCGVRSGAGDDGGVDLALSRPGLLVGDEAGPDHMQCVHRSTVPRNPEMLMTNVRVH
jgi:hypothetical protein